MAHNDQRPSGSSEASSVLAVKQLESPIHAVQSISNHSSSSNASSGSTVPLGPGTVRSDALDSKGSPALLNNAQGPSHSRPTLVQLGSNTTPAAPHPKKYNASNINKKFLEKNSTSSSAFPTSLSSVSTKSGAKPTTQSSASSSSLHPRLVTTKLTATSQLSSSPGPGWSRPSSVTPPVANPSPNGAPTPSQASASTSVPAAPQLPHVGKVIQPQPRSVGLTQAIHREVGHAGAAGQAKSAWGKTNAATASATRADARTQSDFPTAAEVAQVGRMLKSSREKDSEVAEASKQARMEEADTFRGVHLDPNAHHWDDMEEDDDNFLDGVIEFGDGRQYKIDTNTESAPSVSSPPRAASYLDSLQDIETSEPVSKEDRFADDFDRSWPRNKPTPDFAPPSGPRVPNNVSPPTSQSAHSPLESSRVLFNERSNRLEPYNNARDLGRSTPSSDSRFVRNSATSLGSGNDVQLLQKPAPGEGLNRGRGYNGVNEKLREREVTHRDAPPHQQQLPHRSPRMGSNSLPFERDVPPDQRGRRLSNMAPPPVPPHAVNRHSGFRDNNRQLPPHLAHPPSAPSLNERRQSSRESRYSARPPSSAGQSSVRHPSQSPVLSHTAAAAPGASPVLSTIESSISAPQLSGPLLDEVRKDLMQSAAARAKQRRQQEEEEREKEKERARRKAAELEARLEAERTEKEQVEREKMTQQERAKASTEDLAAESQELKVSTIIQEAVSSVQQAKPSTAQVNGVSFGKLHRSSSAWAPPSSQTQDPSSKPLFSRKTSSFAPNTPVIPSGSAESWRTKPHAPPIQTRQASPPPPPERPRAMSFATPPPSALDQVDSISELEVVDYSDLAKFVGVTETAGEESEASQKTEAATTMSPVKSRRPVASDFFEEEPSTSTAPAAEILPSMSTRSDTSHWRTSKLSRSSSIPQQDENRPSDDISHPTRQSKPAAPEVVVSAPSKPPPVEKPSAAPSAPPVAARRNQYKEAAMSALDDAMSRIKGALDVMHEEEHKSSPPESSPKHLSVPSPSFSPSRPERRISPAFRGEPQPIEPFASTCPEPPRSPKPAWNVFTVNLPKNSVRREPIDRRQMAAYNKYQPFRWDILSFVPPVDGMSKKELSLNTVLFQKSYYYRGYKGKLKYPVSLPKASPSTLRVNLPSRTLSSRSVPSAGAFGKPTGADGASTWRKSNQPARVNVEESESAVGLNTTSRSPPPEPEPASAEAKKTEELLTESEDNSSGRMRARSQPKMPAGSGVGFYRNAVVNTDSGSKSSVSFFATVELEIPSKTTPDPESAQTIPTTTQVLTVSTSGSGSGTQSSSSSITKPSSPSSSQFGLPSLIHSGKTESNKSSEDSADRAPITPPTHHTPPWARSSLGLSVKESPVRVPDPEHLKAVWSQTSNQPGLHPVNSLDGITDDLPTVPFTIQDVKSEDGETPPPTSIAPSRMSLHEVTRAFQQVPSSTGMAPHRPTISPPSTTAPVARPTPTTTAPYAYPPPPVQPPSQNIRPQYGSFHPSPMMSHSPAPGVMYTHASPIPPNRMQVNGHMPPYSPVWMPLQSPNTQNSPMMRPMTANYPNPPMMPYHSPGAPQPMYSMHPPNMSAPSQQSTPNRGGRTVSMMSPAVSHAVPAMPMYPAGSPAMMPVHAGRGGTTPGRNDGSHPHPPQHHPLPPQPFAPAGSFSGSRQPW
ncbi:hypothetical protein GYMLUDRAFT_79405 [Collybiopsis luxurians FD-317 M1]|nr:hypothetical protein GYMLUDRAFT_79405 [Collybiopsis luxurians FD-317 M1]